MNKVIIYGEFIEESSTGIAYINSNLYDSLTTLGNKVEKIYEPRAKDYKKDIGKIKKNINFKYFLKVIIKILKIKKSNYSFITLSMNNLGLLKTLIIQLILIFKSNKIFLYIHRGDLNKHYQESLYKKFYINLIFKNSSKVIFLSNLLLEGLPKHFNKNKFLIIPNSLSEYDCSLSKKIFEKKIKFIKEDKQLINVIYSSNIHKQKGIHKIVNAIKFINKNQNDYKINLDIYGIKFEDINDNDEYINFKGKLSTKNRLEAMSKYDFLILASLTEGLPITLIECCAIGLPFITTNVGAIPDLLFDNYPYICNKEFESIIYNIKKIIYDIKENKELLKITIIRSHFLFQDKFTSRQYLENIEKYIY